MVNFIPYFYRAYLWALCAGAVVTVLATHLTHENRHQQAQSAITAQTAELARGFNESLNSKITLASSLAIFAGRHENLSAAVWEDFTDRLEGISDYSGILSAALIGDADKDWRQCRVKFEHRIGQALSLRQQNICRYEALIPALHQSVLDNQPVLWLPPQDFPAYKPGAAYIILAVPGSIGAGQWAFIGIDYADMLRNIGRSFATPFHKIALWQGRENSALPMQLIWESPTLDPADNIISGLSAFSALGHNWEIHAQTSVPMHHDWLITALLGTFITLLIGYVFFILARTGQTAQSLAQQMTEKLRESELRSRILMNLSPSGIWHSDAKGQCQYVNPKWQELTGAGYQESMGLGWIEYINNADKPGILAAWQKAVDFGHEFKAEFRFGQGDAAVWVAAHARPLVATGSIEGFIGTISDISDSKKTQADLVLARDRFQNLFDNSNDAILLLRQDGSIADCNRMAQIQLEVLNKSRLLDRPIADFLTTTEGERNLPSLLAEAMAYGHCREEIALTNSAGMELYAELALKRVQLQGEDLILLTLHNLNKQKKIEQDLRTASQRLELAIAGSNDGLWDWDLQTNQVYFSTRWKQQLGYTDEELVNDYMAWESRLHADDLPKAKQAIQDHLDGKTEIYSFEHRLRHKDGGWRWFLGRGKCAYDDTGKPVRMTGFNTDITDLKQSSIEQNRNRQLLIDAIESIDAGFVLSDEQDRLILANSNFARIYNIPKNLLARGTPYRDIIRYKSQNGVALPPSMDTAEWENMRYEQHRKQYRLYDEFKFHDIWLRVVDRRTFDDYTVSLHYDITTLKEQSETLAESRATADAANQAKSDFLAMISHEIRTPMNGIIGMAELLLSTDLTEEQKNFGTTLRHSAQSLLTIINDVLDFSKIEAGKLKIDRLPFTIDTMMAQVVNLLQNSAANKGLELKQNLRGDISVPVLGDANRLQQVLFNLLGNAIKFTNQGRVEITADLVPMDATRKNFTLRVEITDTGIGIPPEMLDKLFTPYEQAAQSIARRYGGTGLGLAISKQIIELMGGEIGVSSEYGQGSRFWFELRLAAAQAMPEIPPAQPLIQAPGESVLRPGLPILVAEDNKVNQMVIAAMLKKMGYRVDIANNGREALAMAQQKSYALILMDIQMPDMDGVQASLAIRQSPNTQLAQIPIIAITANAMPGDGEYYLSQGMNGYVTKPIHSQELQTAIAAVYPSAG
jgi:PAS domain S-box-containing protein